MVQGHRRERGHVADRLVEYFSGSLPPVDERTVEAHLLACAACQREYAELGEVALRLVRLPPDGWHD
jgi:anti-sigma factor RsiW